VKSIQDPKSHGYPSFRGKLELREAVADWMKRRHDVELDPKTEVQMLVGAKEGLAMCAMAFTNPGDINIVPDPYYPVLSRGTWIACGEIHHMPLREENNFLPDLDAIPEDVAKRAKILIINYPNNPTGAIAPVEFLEKAVAYCKKHSILLISDLAYGEVVYDGYRPPSIFSIEGAKDIAVEFHSCSKTFNMAGWRVGFVCGKQEFIDAIYTMKSNVDYGTATIVQDAAITALNIEQKYIEETMNKYRARRELIEKAFTNLGWKVNNTPATMYFWLKVPEGYSSKEFCKMVLDKTGVVFTPGIAFGAMSDDRFRVSIVADEERLKEAFARIEQAGIRYN
jgi:LL-diaminopimelate aminotransferase